MKTLLRLLLLVLLVCCAAAGWIAWEAKQFLDAAPATPGAEVLFDVEPGAPFARVARQLADKGLITDARKFGWLARVQDMDGKLQAGRFALHTGWTPDKILDQLVFGKPVLYRITLREGLPWWDVARQLEQAGFVRFDDFREVIHDPAFLRHYGIPFASAEGFLMPDTYLLKKPDEPDKAAARAVAGRMVDTFWQKTAALWPDGKKPQRDELRRLVILASIVEKETGIPSERARVAGVYTNRLQRNMLLQADPTVIYGLGPDFTGSLRRSQLNDAQNAYNTYQRAGLTPGPICSPGVAAVRAAIKPEEHNYLYFVAKTDGGEHDFSRTLEEHNRAVRRYMDSKKKK